MKGREKKKSLVSYLPIYGCISTGIIYLAVGVIAILSFLKVKRGGADESSLLAFLNEYFIGKVFVWIILLGTISYIVWRIYESLKDPYDYGKGAKGIALRTGIALSTIPDALIAYSAVLILLGGGNIRQSGQPDEERQLVGDILKESWGPWCIIAVGIIISVSAIVQLMYGVTRGYRERLNIDFLSKGLKKLVYLLAWAGYFARGGILGIIGFFFMKAGITEKAHFVVNTDKAFDFIGDELGHAYFILVAIGTICYGLFMFAFGLTYDADND